MKGRIEGIENWTYDDVDGIMDEAGIIRDEVNPNVYATEAIDATEVICVLENLYDGIQFNQREHDRLARYMKRGFIGRPCFLNWLKRCNRKPLRAAKVMPDLGGLFA